MCNCIPSLERGAAPTHIVYHSTSFGTKFFQHDYKTIQPKIRQFWKETWALMLICYCLFNLCTCFFKCSIYLLSLDAMHIRYWPCILDIDQDDQIENHVKSYIYIVIKEGFDLFVLENLKQLNTSLKKTLKKNYSAKRGVKGNNLKGCSFSAKFCINQ